MTADVTEKAPLPIAGDRGNGIDRDPGWKQGKRILLPSILPPATGLGGQSPASRAGNQVKGLRAGEVKEQAPDSVERGVRRKVGKGIGGNYLRAKVREM